MMPDTPDMVALDLRPYTDEAGLVFERTSYIIDGEAYTRIARSSCGCAAVFDQDGDIVGKTANALCIVNGVHQ